MFPLNVKQLEDDLCFHPVEHSVGEVCQMLEYSELVLALLLLEDPCLMGQIWKERDVLGYLPPLCEHSCNQINEQNLWTIYDNKTNCDCCQNNISIELC